VDRAPVDLRHERVGKQVTGLGDESGDFGGGGSSQCELVDERLDGGLLEPAVWVPDRFERPHISG
jgi:hypothetical protein